MTCCPPRFPAAILSRLWCTSLDLVTSLDPPATAAWRHLDSRAGFEVVYFRADDHAITLEGVTAAIEAGRAWVVDYTIEIDRSWRTRRATIRAHSLNGSRSTCSTSSTETPVRPIRSPTRRCRCALRRGAQASAAAARATLAAEPSRNPRAVIPTNLSEHPTPRRLPPRPPCADPASSPPTDHRTTLHCADELTGSTTRPGRGARARATQNANTERPTTRPTHRARSASPRSREGLALPTPLVRDRRYQRRRAVLSASTPWGGSRPRCRRTGWGVRTPREGRARLDSRRRRCCMRCVS
jgi:hypothetical protein